MSYVKVQLHRAGLRQPGAYEIRDSGIEDCEFWQDGELKFTLTASEVQTYIQMKGIVVLEGHFP